MGRIRFEGEGTVNARPEVVWDILTDYRDGHQRILPKPFFSALTVEEGGKGAGTVMAFDTHLNGSTRHFHQRVSAPEPGRVLVEHDIDGTGATTFTLTPVEGGARTRLHIETDTPGSDGLRGALEGLFMPMVRGTTTRIYAQEITNLDALAQTWTMMTPASEGV